jgi:ubiquinone/menaquinone biosynthesis C-methylase UbiE
MNMNTGMTIRVPHSESDIIAKMGKELRHYRYGKVPVWLYKDCVKKLKGFMRGGRFLEVGTGGGVLTGLVAEVIKPYEITGLDTSGEMIIAAEKYIDEIGFGNRISFKKGKVEDSVKVNSLGKFNLIYSAWSLHHWEDAEKGITNLYRALSPEGILFIYDFYRSGIFSRIPYGGGIGSSIRAAYTPEEISVILNNLNVKAYNIKTKNLRMEITVWK